MSTQEKDMAYFEAHPEELTDEIAEHLLLGLPVEGDTTSDEDEETGEEPAAGADEEPPQKDATEKEQPVILAKDGKHTIPYEELESSRAESKRLAEQLREQQALIEQLKAAKAEDAKSGTTEATDELIANLKEDYPTLAEAVQKLIDMKVGEAVASVSKELEPLKANARLSAEDAHFAAIRQEHEDFDSIIESGKLHDWVKGLPSYARPGAEAVMKGGSAADVISLLSDFKQATGKPDEVEVQPTTDTAAKAAKVIAKAKEAKAIPNSLSDVPSGGLPASDELGSLENMSDNALLGAFLSMDPAKVSEKLARLL